MEQNIFNTGYRSSLDIINDILLVAEKEEGVKKTHIMYRANLSFKLLSKYMNKIINSKLLHKRKTLFFITEKGKEFVRNYHDYQNNRTNYWKQHSLLTKNKDILDRMLKTSLSSL